MSSEQRHEGITMLLRLKNEEEWIEPSIQSIQWADLIVCCFQNSTDRTEEIVRDTSDSLKTLVYHYPHDSRPNGPGHDEQPYDQYNRAYFYNWCYYRTATNYIVKWDGDMVAQDGLERCLRDAYGNYDTVFFYGTDIVIEEDKYYVKQSRPFCSNEPRMFRARESQPWRTGRYCEAFAYSTRRSLCLESSLFLHFKWSKSLESATKAWGKDWEQHEHFRRIVRRGSMDDTVPYNGDIPRCLIRTT